MDKFEITITYSKVIEAGSLKDAEYIANSIYNSSNLTDEYGPFDSLDGFTSVKPLKDEDDE